MLLRRNIRNKPLPPGVGSWQDDSEGAAVERHDLLMEFSGVITAYAQLLCGQAGLQRLDRCNARKGI
jgi:hypothetical protein